MREHETLTSNTFQLAEVLVVRPEVLVVRPEVPVVRQFCHKKIQRQICKRSLLIPLKKGRLTHF